MQWGDFSYKIIIKWKIQWNLFTGRIRFLEIRKRQSCNKNFFRIKFTTDPLFKVENKYLDLERLPDLPYEVASARGVFYDK